MKNLFCEGLVENDVSKLLLVPKSDLHNHSGKGCTIEWLKEKLKVYWSRFLVTLWSENNYFDLASIGVKYPLAECGLT